MQIKIIFTRKVLDENLFCTYLIDETGYEARETSKEQTKMPRFMLEGPRHCKMFCVALIHYA